MAPNAGDGRGRERGPRGRAAPANRRREPREDTGDRGEDGKMERRKKDEKKETNEANRQNKIIRLLLQKKKTYIHNVLKETSCVVSVVFASSSLMRLPRNNIT